MAQAEFISVGCILRLPDRGPNMPCEAAECMPSILSAQARESKKNKFCQLDKHGYGHPIAVLYTTPTTNADNVSELKVTFVKVGFLNTSSKFVQPTNHRCRISSLGNMKVNQFIDCRNIGKPADCKTFSPMCWIKSPKEPEEPDYTVRYHLGTGNTN